MTACTTRGWRCPRMKAAGPPEKSRYSFPSMSRTIAPSASHSTVSPPRRKSRTSPGLTNSPYLRNVSSTIRRRSAGSMPREASAAAGWRDSAARPHRGPGLQGPPRPADDLPRFPIFDPRHRFVEGDPLAGDKPFLFLRRGLLAAEELHQIIVHRLVVVAVLGAPEEKVALFAQVTRDAEVRKVALLLHLPPGHGFGSLARFDGAFGQHPLAALVLQQQNLWTRGCPAKDAALRDEAPHLRFRQGRGEVLGEDPHLQGFLARQVVPPAALEGLDGLPPPFDFPQEDVLDLVVGQRPLLFDLRVLDRGAGEPDRGDTHGVAGAQSLAKIRFQLLPETHRRTGSGVIGGGAARG